MAIDYSKTIPNEYVLCTVDELVDALNKHLGKKDMFLKYPTPGLQVRFPTH